MLDFEILGLGTALPEHQMQQSEAADFAALCLTSEGSAPTSGGLVKVLFRRAGVQTRHSTVLESSESGSPSTQTFYAPSTGADDRGPSTSTRMDRYEIDAPLLAGEAVRLALAEAGVSPLEVTHLVTVSCSGFSAPGVDLHLLRTLGMRPSVSRTHIGFMGCHGALNGLRVAQAFAAADPAAVIVICAIELCTLHYQYGLDPQSVVANSLFADGAAAIVGRAVRPTSKPRGTALPGRLVENFSYVIPETEEMMSWRIGDNGFQMTLSPEVPAIITRTLPGALETFLGRHSLALADIRSWAIHPGGPRILKACGEAANLSEDDLAASTSILSRCGNMSSPTVLFILDELRRQKSELPCVLLGFGPGLNVEAALLR